MKIYLSSHFGQHEQLLDANRQSCLSERLNAECWAREDSCNLRTLALVENVDATKDLQYLP